MEISPLTCENPEVNNISESFELNQDDNNYKLNIEIIDKDIILNVLEKKRKIERI